MELPAGSDFYSKKFQSAESVVDLPNSTTPPVFFMFFTVCFFIYSPLSIEGVFSPVYDLDQI